MLTRRDLAPKGDFAVRHQLRRPLDNLEDRRLPATDLLGVASSVTHSTEQATALVRDSYEQILHRAPDPGGLTHWVNLLNQGLSPAGLEAYLAGSPEDVARTGGSAAWLSGLYQDLLGRAPDPDGLKSWSSGLAAGMSPVQVAAGFATSPERASLRVGQLYLQYLRRLASSDEVRGWADRLLAGADPRDVAAEFLSSAEYRGRFGSDDAWLSGVYQDALGRPAAPSEVRYWLGGDPGPGGFVRGQPAIWGAGDSQAADYNDVIQEQSPTCFIAAALAAVARTGADLAARIRYLGGDRYEVPIATPQVDAYYRVTGFGPVQNVVVSFDGTHDPATDLAVSPEGDIWPLLYQRAYVQVFGYSDSGSAAFAVMALTGQVNVPAPGANWAYGAKTPQGAGDLSVIAAALAGGEPVIADTGGATIGTILDATTGLIARHSYAVIAADAGGVTLYNPWGVDTDWRLLDANGDHRLSAAERRGSPDGRDGNFDDGLIRISLATFVANFTAYVTAAPAGA
jgi:hypothetical protein